MHIKPSRVLTTSPGLHNKDTHIVVLMGGMSEEREVSLSSGKGITENLIDMGYRVTAIDMGYDIPTYLTELKPNLVFNALHGTYGEDGCVAGMLEIMQIPYTHSGVLASAVGLNKIFSYNIFVDNGILCPKRIIVNRNDNIKTDPLPRPYVIKPVSEGSSIGVLVIFAEDSFNFAEYDYPYGDQIIIEEYIAGREIQVAIVGDKALSTLEIQLLERRFFDYDSKYKPGLVKKLIPAPLTEKQEITVLALAEKAHNLLGCSSVNRVEFIFDEERDKFYLLEVNTHPGFTPLSIVPAVAAQKGIDFKALLTILIDKALEDFRNKHSAMQNGKNKLQTSDA